MKIPKSLKLPRKLKKELKKGFERNVTPHYPVFDPVCRENGMSLSMYETVSYTGSNTKSFRRLCKYARKEEKRIFEKMMQEEMCKQIYKTYVDNVPVGLHPAIDNIIQMQREINKNQTVVAEFWKDPTIQSRYIACFDPANENNYSIAGTHEY